MDEFGIKDQIKFIKTANYSNNKNNEKPKEASERDSKAIVDEEINPDVHGFNEFYPVEGFIEFYSAQNNRKIKLHTYKYPAQTNIKGIVYYVYFILFYKK